MPSENNTSGKEAPFDPVDHLLPPARKQSAVGPTVGIIIILVLLIIGALYFWGASLNRPNPNDNLPFIPGDGVVVSTEDSV